MKLLNIIIFFVFVIISFNWGQVPRQISYQGYLTDNSGQPLSGTKTLTFRFYNAETGGNLLYTDVQDSVDIDAGYFNTIIGKGNPITLDFNEQYWITMQVDNGPEIVPRMRLTSSAYSLNAASTGDISNISAGGDLTGTYPNPSIVKLQGNTVNASTPTTGHVLKWKGSAWEPDIDQTGTSGNSVQVTGRLSGDGTSTYPLDIAQQNATSGQVLKWNGNWIPADDDVLTDAGGDLTGTYPNPSIANDAVTGTKIQDRTIQAADISLNSISETELAPNSVNSSEIVANAVDSDEIADNAVNASKVHDEPGIATVYGPTFFSLQNSVINQTVTSLTITTPSAGKIVLEGCGYITVDHAQTADDNIGVNILLDPVNDEVYTPGVGSVRIPTVMPASANYRYPFSCRNVLSVNSDTTATFYLVVKQDLGANKANTDIRSSVLHATFYPTAYGQTPSLIERYKSSRDEDVF